jgi:predicted RNA-binding protein with PIN domain
MYLVDGNNVMGQRVGWHRDKPGSRLRLIRDLARFVRLREVRLAVVFDGAPDESVPDGSSYRGVRVFYSRRGSDADARIVEIVESERNRKSIVVITSDNKLAARIRACGVRVVRSGEFRRILDATTEGQGSKSGVKNSEMNEWMRYFGVGDGDE